MDEYARRITSGEPFAQANYGDGEWTCMLHPGSGSNCDAHHYFDDLGAALCRTVLEPRGYWYGLNPGLKMMPEVGAWCDENDLQVDWVEKNTLSDANWRGELGPVIRALRTRRVMLVGSPVLNNLRSDALSPVARVEIPSVNCWLAVDEIVASIRRQLKHDPAIDLIAFSASMATNVMIWLLWPALGDRMTMIDFGAIWDPYVGIPSRKRYRDAENPQRIARNL